MKTFVHTVGNNFFSSFDVDHSILSDQNHQLVFDSWSLTDKSSSHQLSVDGYLNNIILNISNSDWVSKPFRFSETHLTSIVND